MTKIFGIVNITPDSFSDGGHNFIKENAIKTFAKMKEFGVYAIDIGAESTRPNAISISTEEEILRLQNILPIAIEMGLKVSLDTRNFKTAKWGLEHGISILNDVTGFADENMILLLKQFKVQGIFMHSLDVPVNPAHIMKDDVFMQEIYDFAQLKIEKFLQYGISKENLIFDPGIGFGKTGVQNINIIRNIDYFYSLGVKILVGHSRKSFLKTAFPQDYSDNILCKDLMTSTFSAYLIAKNVDFLRLHNPNIISSFIENN